MYDDHYGLSGRPFQLTPDPRFWFDTATHRKAMAYLGYGLSQGEGFIVITGDPGAGKTTLLGHLMEGIDAERLNVIKIVTTQIQAEDLLHMVAAGMGVESTGLPKAKMLAEIERALHAVARTGRRTLLIVDEAQGLPTDSLEELRMLSNFQAGGYPLLQIFLLGQPEFRARLHDPKLEQLRQRVIAMHHLEPMGPEELEPYLIHRLSVVGWRGRPRFTNDAIAVLHRWSGGVPRRVNTLASRVLLFGAVEQIDTFSGADVEAVIADVDSDTPTPSAAKPPVPAPVPVVIQDQEPEPEAQPEPQFPAPFQLRPTLQPEVPMSGPRAVEMTPEPAPEPQAPAADDLTAARLAAIEERLDEQDAAIRRVLSLLVDWVETDQAPKPNISPLRGNAA